MSNAEYVRSILLECPDISKDSPAMMIDFLGLNPMQYSIDGEPTGQIIKKYFGGDTLRRYSFALSARRDFAIDEDRAANNANYEKLSLWLERQTRFRRLPPMEGGAAPLKIEATGSPFILERVEGREPDTAIYLMQIELTYTQKARNDL